MATRVKPTPQYADNNAGTFQAAARNDWRCSDADSMSARVIKNPLQMPDIRLQAVPVSPNNSVTHHLRGESIYELLGPCGWTMGLGYEGRLERLVQVTVPRGLRNAGEFELRVLGCYGRRSQQLVAEANMPLPVGAVLFEHVQMMGAPRSAENKVVPARNAVLPTILVAESYQERHERVEVLKGLNGNSDVKDRLCENPWNGRAPDVLNVDRDRSKRSRKPIPLSREAQRPFRADGDQTQFTGIQTEIWSVGVVLHRFCEIAWDGPNVALTGVGEADVRVKRIVRSRSGSGHAATSRKISGWRSAIFSRVWAAPDGLRRPCSHCSSVRFDTPSTVANSA